MNKLFAHIKEQALCKNIYLDMINGYTDHVHCLVWLRADQTVGQIAQMIKGESAHWFNNRSGFSHAKLQWQDQYYAVAVCLSALKRVRAYIAKQEQYHEKRSFDTEIEELEKIFLFKKDLDNSLAHFDLKAKRD